MTHNHVVRARHLASRAQHRAHSELDHAQRRLASLSSEARVRGAAVFEKLKDRGGELLKEAQHRGKKSAKASGEWIGENPARAVGIAFVAGLIVRGLLSRRED